MDKFYKSWITKTRVLVFAKKSYSSNIFLRLFCCALLLTVFNAKAQPLPPSVTTQPSNFPVTCQPNSATTFGHSQSFVVNNGDCKNQGNNGAFTFEWEYRVGNSPWVPITSSTLTGFSYTPTSSQSVNGNTVIGTANLAITISPDAATGTFEFRSVATYNKCNTNKVTSAPITFTVNPKAVPTFTEQPGSTGCINSSYTYTTQAGQMGYIWSGLGVPNTDYEIVSGSIGTASHTVTLKWLTPGTKTVSINYSNSTGCTAFNSTSSTPTTITSAPTPIFTSGSTNACVGNDVTYTTQPGFSNYVWVFPGSVGTDYSIISGGNSTSNTVTLRWLSPGNKMVAVNYSNANGCAATNAASYATLVNAIPAATFTTSPGTTTCLGNNVTYTTQSGQSSYLWSVSGILNTDYIISGGGLGSSDNTVTLQWITNGNKTVTVNYNNTSGCTSTASATSNTTVSFAAIPKISAAGPLTFCDGGSVTLTSDAATTYQWYLDGNLISGATAQSYVANSTGSYVVRVTNAAGCEATSASTTITENAVPDITVSTQASSLCFIGGAQISQLNYSSTDGSPTSYSIAWNGAAAAAGFQDISNGALPASQIPIAVPATASGNTVYTGNLTVTNANGCISTVKTFTVALTSPPDVSNFSISATSGCAGTGSLVTVASSTIVNGTYTVTYALTGANAVNTTATMIFNNGSGTFLASAPIAGTTNIAVTQLALVGCSSPVSSNNTAQFTVNNLPSVSAIAGSPAVCIGGTTVLTNTTPGGVWTTSEPSIATISSTGEVTGVVAGSVIITYTTAPDGTTGCANSVTRTVTVNALPEVQAITGPRNLCVNSSSTLLNATTGGTWMSSNPEFATIDPASGLVTTHAVGSTTITYTTAADGQGCASRTAVTVNVQPPPTVIAGPVLEVCESATPVGIALGDASFGGSATSATWVIVEGGGTLSNTGPTTEPASVIYTPAANFSGTVTLSLVSNALNSCTPVSEQRVINVTGKPVVVAGDEVIVCQSANPSAITLSGSSISGGATMGTWSVSGGGTLSNTSPASDPSLVTYTPEANFAGTVTLTLTSNASGTCEVVSATRVINVTAPPTAVAGANLSTCGTGVAVNISGGATATNYTSLTWQTSGSGSFTNITSLSGAMYTPSDADIIAGSVTITLRVNGGACEDAVSPKTLTITPAATAIAGTDITVCAAPGAVNITAGSSATNTSAVLWTSNGTGTISDPTSLISAAYTPGVGETGSITLTLTATGNSPCGDAVSTKSIIINPNAELAITSAAATSAQTVCLGTAIGAITYSITGGGTGATFSGLPAGVTGTFLNGVATISGTATTAGTSSYTITTTGGTCGQASLSGTINVSAVTVGGAILPAVVTGCTGTINGNITLNGSIGNVMQWESSTNGGATWDVISNTTLTQSYTGVGQTTIYRALVQSVNCPSAYSAISVVSLVPKYNPTATASAPSICVGQNSVLSSTTGYPTPGISAESGSFSDANPTGWLRDGCSNCMSANRDNAAPGPWGETNGPTVFSNITYNGAGGKFAVVDGPLSGQGGVSILETPVFSLIAQDVISFEFLQAYNLAAGANAKIEISTNGGASYTQVLAEYLGGTSLGINGAIGTLQPLSIPLTNYIGQANLRIRFVYKGTTGSSWALDNVRVPAVLPITYAWTSNPASTFGNPTLGSVTVSPTVTTTYTLTTKINGCDAGSTTVTVTVNPLPVLTLGGTLTNGTVITCFGSTTAILPYTGTDLPTGSKYDIVWSGANTAGFAAVTNADLPTSQIILAVPPGMAAGSYTGMISIRNTNNCTGASRPFTLIVNPAPTLGSLTAAPLCNITGSAKLTINLTGLLPNSTSSITYQIGGGTAVTAAGIVANGSGIASFQASVTAANDGQSLIITSISSTTTNSISCAITPTTNNTLILMVKSGYVWTGASGIDNKWSTDANWLCGVEPPNLASVIIPQVAIGIYPIMDVDFASHNFDLHAGATVNIDNRRLQLGTSGGSVINTSGMFIGSPLAKVITYGTFPTTIKFDQATIGFTNALLTFSMQQPGEITLGNPLWIIQDLYPNGSVMNSDGHLTMVSTATTSSNIGPMGTTANVNGDVNVQVYITGDGVNTANRGYRVMSSPINDAGITSGKKSFAQIKDYIVVTGVGGEANGFDQGGWAQPEAETITRFNEPALPTAPNFVTIPTINEHNVSGTGFYLFFRGKQGGNYDANFTKVNAPYAAPEPVTMTYRGPINKFAVPPVVLHNSAIPGDATNGYNMIGNPFPSSIDWNNVVKSSTKVLNTVITYKVGGMQVSYTNGVGNNGGTSIIAPGQGFYVVTEAEGETISFTEAAKSASYPGRFLKAPIDQQITMSSAKPLAFGSDQIMDKKELLRLNISDGKNSEETTLVFEEGNSEKAGYEDVVYMSGGVINLASMSSDDRYLAINGLPEISKVKEVRLNMNGSISGAYKFRFTDIPKFKGCQILLKDALFPDLLTEMKKVGSYDFVVDKSKAETFGKRFTIIFKPVAVKKPLEVKTFTVDKATNAAELQWVVTGDYEPVSSEVEHSTDGKTFVTVASVTVKEKNADKKFQFTDFYPQAGDNFYRVKIVGELGDTIYSTVKKVSFLESEISQQGLAIYPNPAKDHVEFKLLRRPDGTVNVSIYDLYGRQVFLRESAKHELIKYDMSTLMPAVYMVEIRSNSNNKLLGRTKFVKSD